MRSRLLNVLWPCAMLCFAAAVALALIDRGAPITRLSAVAISVLVACGTGCALFVAGRVLRFRTKLAGFLRHWLAGDYQVGIQPSLRCGDEVTALEELVNRFADQLRAYDRLRAERVGLVHGALHILLHCVPQAVALADVDRQMLLLNPAWQWAFGLDSGSIEFRSLRCRQENAQFFAALDDTIGKNRVAQNIETVLRFPARESQRTVALTMVPVKDHQENVRLVLLLVRGSPSAAVQES